MFELSQEHEDFRKVVRNADPSRYSFESAGHLGFGDQSGSKQSADRTWLADAVRGAHALRHVPQPVEVDIGARGDGDQARAGTRAGTPAHGVHVQ